MGLRDMIGIPAYWILAPDRDQWRPLVYMVMQFSGLIK
jgi:hypothetical protein